MSDPATPDAQVTVTNAETVNVPGDIGAHPATVYIVAFVTCGVLIGFGWVTFAILNSDVGSIDAATKGAVIQTWNNLAVAAAAVWTAGRVVDRLQGKRP